MVANAAERGLGKRDYVEYRKLRCALPTVNKMLSLRDNTFIKSSKIIAIENKFYFCSVLIKIIIIKNYHEKCSSI